MLTLLRRAGWLASVALATWACTTAQAAPFKDPLLTPVSPRAGAEKGRLMAVATSQGRWLAVGADGVILASDDGGKGWQQCPAPVSSDLVAVRMLDKERAWAVGYDGVVLHTSDGCRSWTKQLDGRLAAQAVLAHYQKRLQNGDADAAQLVAEAERLVEEGPDKPFFDVMFLNAQEGFAVGAFNYALQTRDGGKTWEPLGDRTANPQGLHLYGLVQAGGQLYLVGEQGLLRRWLPQAQRFEVVESPYKGSFFGAYGDGEQLLVFGMRGHVFRSTDGAQTWSRVAVETEASLTAGFVTGTGKAVLTTFSGQLLSGDVKGVLRKLTPAKPMGYTGVAAGAGDSVVLTGSAGVRVEPLAARTTQD